MSPSLDNDPLGFGSVFSIDDASVLIETVTYSPLAIKLVAFGEVALIQLCEASSHPGMNEGSSRFYDDSNLIVVAVDEPVEGHRPALATVA